METSENWHKFLIPCEPRHAVLLEGMLKEEGVAVVLKELPNAYGRYASYATQEYRREFFIREGGVVKARDIIQDFCMQYEIPQASCQEIEPTNQQIENSIEDQMMKQKFQGLLFRIGVLAVVLAAIVYFFLNE